MTANQTAPRTLADVLARRDEILDAAARHGARNVRVFGSIVRGEADERSDLDLLVEMEPGRSLLDLAGLHLELEEMLGCEVDIGTKIKPRLRERIEVEAVPL
ncbi:MAG: nucleotidyltransferase family protein [Gaiellaceae bacterium]